jgi:anti-sigma regulatory factor (Ser/Thr protein kinase)
MPFYACPNCGSSSSDAGGPPLTTCPWCCATMRVEDDVPSAAPVEGPEPAVRMSLGTARSAPSAARHALTTVRPKLGESRYRVCELLVSELVTNVVRHSAGDGSGPASDMRVRVYPDRVRVEVRDEGPGFTPSDAEAESDPGSGWGLFLVDELADEWGIESGSQNCVWFELARTPLASGFHAAVHH